MEKKDIQNEADILNLVKHFYNYLLEDTEINHFFLDLDLEEHLPRVASFWEFILLNKEGYKVNVMEKHMHLPIKKADIYRWLGHFKTSVDDLFEGETAEFAKSRADLISKTFEIKFPN
ncbi:MAG: group III truncated hemoglobin [Bacteroidia bacterium]